MTDNNNTSEPSSASKLNPELQFQITNYKQKVNQSSDQEITPSNSVFNAEQSSTIEFNLFLNGYFKQKMIKSTLMIYNTIPLAILQLIRDYFFSILDTFQANEQNNKYFEISNFGTNLTFTGKHFEYSIMRFGKYVHIGNESAFYRIEFKLHENVCSTNIAFGFAYREFSETINDWNSDLRKPYQNYAMVVFGDGLWRKSPWFTAWNNSWTTYWKDVEADGSNSWSAKKLWNTVFKKGDHVIVEIDARYSYDLRARIYRKNTNERFSLPKGVRLRGEQDICIIVLFCHRRQTISVENVCTSLLPSPLVDILL